MTQLFKLNEHLIAAMVARLTADLPGVIDTINAEATDGLVIPYVDQVLDYVPTPTILNRFPTVAVQDGPSDFQDDVGWSATGVHDLVLVTFVQDADQQRLATMLRRYTRAVANVAMAGRTVGDAWGVTLNGILPGPTLGRGEEPREWISYTGVSVRLKSEEDNF
jgi:hypothetical protein